MLLRPARSVHTVGMRFPIDVAYCDADCGSCGRAPAAPPRSCPVRRARAVIEAEAGAFARWNLRAGDQLEVKG